MEWDAESGGLRCRSCGAKVSVQKAAPEGFHDYESLPSFPAIQDDKEKSVRWPRLRGRDKDREPYSLRDLPQLRGRLRVR